MESVTLFFILVYIQKKKHRDRQQYQFLGHLHFGQRTNKVVHFRKLEDEKTIKTKKSLTPQLGRKSSHTGSWVLVVRRWWASWDAGHAPSLRPLRCTSMLVGVERGDVHLLQSLSLRLRQILPISPYGQTSVKVLKVAFVEGTGPTALTKASSVRRLCSLVIIVVS